jgi:DNA-binding SARP family transcriptional activator/tetratricopeptide (TPR) repeat protein
VGSELSFGVLGPLTVSVGGRPVNVGGPRQRAILATLLIHVNRTVTIAELVEAAWDDDPPETARRQVQNAVSELRKAVTRHGVVDPVRSEPEGYRLGLAPQQLDLLRFESFAAEGRRLVAAGDPAAAVLVLREAVSLRRGPALADLPGAVLRRHADRLEQQWLVAVEDCLDQELSIGVLGHSMFAEVESLVRQHPSRERLAAALMLALYRAGRHADALEAYRRLAAALVDELGVDPSPDVQDRYALILRRDPSLDAPAAGAAGSPAPVRPVGSISAVPAELPADVAGFVGRDVELAWLDKVAGGGDAAVVISALSGAGGVGKTALAVRWGHRVADRFPDGQLYVNLRGYDPAEPMSAADGLARLLGALGVPDSEIPVEVEERAARFRSGMAGRRMLVVLDNAATVEQVRPLLPGAAGCVVLVTSRDTLAGLVAVNGAQRLDLDLLPDADALALLRRLIGVRVDVEPDAAAALAGLCDRLPLALRIAAELAAAQPVRPLADLVGELRDRRRRLNLLDAGGDPHAAVSTVFSWSMQHLPPAAARAFRLLGLHPGAEFDAYAAAALTDTDLTAARRALDDLARAHLIQPDGTDRYRMHDLLRAYAAERAAVIDPDTDRHAAQTRLFDYYLAAAAAAMDLLFAAEIDRRPRIARPATPIPDLTARDTARTWLDTELANLVAVAAHTATEGWPTHTTRLSTILFRYFGAGHFIAALAIHGHAHRAALGTGDLIGQAEAVANLGAMSIHLAQHQRAAEYLREALRLFREGGYPVGAARVHYNLGTVEQRHGHYRAAAEHYEQALALHRGAGDVRGEASALNGLGIVVEHLGDGATAAEYHERAVALFAQIGDATGEAAALTNLGSDEAGIGRHDLAAGHLERAVVLFQQIDNRAGEAAALDSLGTLYVRLDQPGRATEYYRRALAIFSDVGDRSGEVWARNGLGEAAHATGCDIEAVKQYTTAHALAVDTGERDQQARAYLGLGRVHRARGDRARARDHFAQALRIRTELGRPDADEVRADLAAIDAQEATPNAQEATPNAAAT